MKKALAYLCLFFVLYKPSIITAQGNPTDSLLKLLAAARHDSTRAKIYSLLTEVCDINEIRAYSAEATKIADKYSGSSNPAIKNKFLGYKATAINNLAFVADAEGDVDKCIQLYKDALAIRESIKDTNAIGNTLFNLAILYKGTGKTNEALDLTQKALVCLTLKNNKAGMSKCYFSLGEISLTRGRIIEAIGYLEKSLKISREFNDKAGTASALTGLGTIQGELGDTKKELEYLNQCLKIQEEIGDKFGLAFTYNNLGYVFFTSGNYIKAKQCYQKSLEYAESISEWGNIALALHNLGNAAYELKDKNGAIDYYKKSIAIRDKIRDEGGKSLTLINLGKIAYYGGNSSEGKKHLLEAHAIGTKLKVNDAIRKSSEVLSGLFASEGDYRSAYLMHTEFKQLSDSMYNKENKKASYKQQVKIEFEKKETETKLLAKTEKEKIQTQANEDRRRARIILASVSCVLLLVFLLAMFIYRGSKQKQKANLALEEKNALIGLQKKEVEMQKELVEEKQKEVMDSIRYAKRIQNAILAKEEDIKKQFPQSFLFYKPKDIVAGDFYFFEVTESHVFYAAADCTGHGVPGALVSVVCSNALSRCVKEFGLTDPGKILDKARELVLETFKKSGQDVKDGMDISLLVKNVSAGSFKWAGANNPLWYISGDEGMKELTANKQPIGLNENPQPFTTHELALSENDSVFLFTDGFADQFGGPKGKKYKYKQFAELLLKNTNLALHDQKERLNSSFENWKGELEQVDDVCVINIRV